MAKRNTRQRAFSMNLAQFDRYLRDKSAELEACAQQIDKIEGRFRAIFQRELEIWQELFSVCYPEIRLRRDEMPAALQRYLDAIEAEELARIQGEIAELEPQITEHRKAMDTGAGQAQSAIKALQEANPKLNQREEELKGRVIELQNAYTEAYERLETLQEPSMSWLSNAGEIRRVKRLQKTIKKQQAEALQELSAVRHEWLNKVQETSETQSQLRESWQEASINSADLQARYDHLVNNLDDLARQDGLQRALSEMVDDPDVEGELGENLTKLCEHNAIRARYEDGLAAASESLGLVRGIGTGLTRFGESVRRVLGEQKRYNLKPIQILVPHDAAVINQTWSQFHDRLRDEKQMAQNPQEFARLAHEYIIDRLTPAVIEHFFDQMGTALNLATKFWD